MTEGISRSSLSADVHRFRDIFFGCLASSDGRLAAELVQTGRHAHLVYLPAESLLAAPRLADGKIRLVRWPDDDDRPRKKTLRTTDLGQILDHL